MEINKDDIGHLRGIIIRLAFREGAGGNHEACPIQGCGAFLTGDAEGEGHIDDCIFKRLTIAVLEEDR